jgi:integrase
MLSRQIDEYLAIRRSVGYKLAPHETALRCFDSFVKARGELHVRASTAIEWAALAGTPREREKRLRFVRQFACYARAEDVDNEIPPRGVFAFAGKRRPTPYIFSWEQISSLMDVALDLEPRGTRRPYTYRTLLGLMAASGLRSREALSLRLGDVTDEGLVIRETKFRKSRLVPLHPTTTAALSQYIEKQRCVGRLPTDDRVFVSLRGRGYSYNALRDTFVHLLQQIGLEPSRCHPRPTLHSLRHSFAVRALEACPFIRGRIGQHMLALSTYLGHTRVSDTYWYLEATPKLMTDIADVCQVFCDRRWS